MTETVEAMKMFLSIKTITQNNLHYTVSILLPSLSNSRMWGKMCYLLKENYKKTHLKLQHLATANFSIISY